MAMLNNQMVHGPWLPVRKLLTYHPGALAGIIMVTFSFTQLIHSPNPKMRRYYWSCSFPGHRNWVSYFLPTSLRCQLANHHIPKISKMPPAGFYIHEFIYEHH